MANVSAVPDVEKDELRASLEKLKRMLPFIAEYTAIDAAIRKAKYDACLDAGFSAQQALEIAKGAI